MCYIPKRYIFTALSLLGILTIYASRVNFSVAIVAMVNNTKENSENGIRIENGCPTLWLNESQAEEEKFKGAKYDWDAKTQALLLSSFYYGYVLTQLLGGVLCDKFGAKWPFGGGILITMSLYLLLPLAAKWGATAFAAIRVLEGMGEGLTFPAVTHGTSVWSAKFERSRMSSIICFGIPLGNILGSTIAGVLSSSDLFGGWPSSFYLFGTIGCVWFLLWCFLAYDNPESHPSISKEELFHIQQTKSEKPQKAAAIPWKGIFSSIPMWAVIIGHFGHGYGFLLFLTMMPTYFKTILHFGIKTNGVLTALPYLIHGLTGLLVSYLADNLRKSNKLSVTTIRKICNTIGTFGPAFCCLGITAIGCQADWIVTLICLSMSLNGFVYSGYNITHIDMSPDYAGVLYGITNTIANTAGIISPLICGIITEDGETVENWNKIFYITSTIYIASGVFFAIFASAEVQPWGLANRDAEKDAQSKDEIYYIERTH